MLIPRYSLRWLLALITAAAAVSFILSFAFRGDRWAIGVSAGLGCLVLLVTMYILTFLTAWVVSQVEGAVFRRTAGEGTSPFAGTTAASPFASPEPGVAAPSEAPPPMTG